VSRPLRILYPGAHYHLMARGKAGERCYRNDADRLLFLELLEHVVERFAWRLYAYCLMSNQSRRSPIEGTHDISQFLIPMPCTVVVRSETPRYFGWERLLRTRPLALKVRGGKSGMGRASPLPTSSARLQFPTHLAE
jgi:hypothetical protein